MVLFLLERLTPLPVDETWRRLTTWERHGDAVPLTRVIVRTPPPNGPGTVFVARTGLGPLAFEDPMEVTFWQSPGGGPARCRLTKRGRIVTGWAEIEVHGTGVGGSRVVWREDLSVRGLPGAADPLLLRASRWMFGRAVRRLLS